MKRDQTYQVVSRSAVTVEFPNGNVVSYPAGFTFQAHPTNASVRRLVRSNLVRAVTPREVPNFNVDTKSSTGAPAPKRGTETKKTTKKPKRGGE